MGKSIEFFGFRFGETADDQRHWCFGIQATGFFKLNIIRLFNVEIVSEAHI
jgi:hypothetical protein